mmetsp:Transcript_43233/g.77701  ORF Transcript_43233/g.77701 Transcript_43233/m.77701 type:complete len:178 (+) Transcript_43233:243-776(+)
MKVLRQKLQSPKAVDIGCVPSPTVLNKFSRAGSAAGMARRRHVPPAVTKDAQTSPRGEDSVECTELLSSKPAPVRDARELPSKESFVIATTLRALRQQSGAQRESASVKSAAMRGAPTRPRGEESAAGMTWNRQMCFIMDVLIKRRRAGHAWNTENLISFVITVITMKKCMNSSQYS